MYILNADLSVTKCDILEGSDDSIFAGSQTQILRMSFWSYSIGVSTQYSLEAADDAKACGMPNVQMIHEQRYIIRLVLFFWPFGIVLDF